MNANNEAPAPPVANAPATDAQQARLLYLFRHTLARGQLNPLLLIVPAYRDEEAE